jgi:hypothetical protein
MEKYLITNEYGQKIEPDILTTYFGSLWQSILDRLPPGFDGFLMSFSIEGQKISVYRDVRLNLDQ